MNIRAYPGIALLFLLASCSMQESDSNFHTNTNTPVYTWVELYADGHRDTVFSENTTAYPQEIAWEIESRVSTFITDNSELPDTVYLNYGPHARDSLVPPQVQIQNKATILSELDTLLRYQPMWPRANVVATHFRGDSLQTVTSDSLHMAFFYNPSTRYCYATDSCSIGFTLNCMYISYNQSASFSYDFGIFPDHFDTSEIHWKFVLSNRFGFKDSLEGTSVIRSPEILCAEAEVAYCQPMLVYHKQITLYSWVEGYADGHRDTIVESDSSHWPGPKPISLLSKSLSNIVQNISLLRMDTVCPGDSLVLDSLGGFPSLYEIIDTVRLNYGADSLFPYLLPKIEFANKDSLVTLAASAQYLNNPMNLSIWINHFRGDSATVELLNPSPHSLYWSAGITSHCEIKNPCDSIQINTCIEVDYADISVWPHLGITMDSTTSGDFPWTLVTRNRFGFADTVSGTTKVLPFSCGE
jgi:hypothetical protein